ncbi:SH3 domain-containing protein [Lentibacter algarum]|uniref:SH3 domain-containing protein n=1 Tax=Lentibacter algarum TaxID=576131 RepID=UPI001C09BFB0|nr:SH3 domain-containing protein [Lentibacter algarum]MBU2983621.1 SH3 domain-containing protein [Lentibacter algarum]
MWRFIVVTFGLLGFSFYELSGGADYAPADGSRQALAAERHEAEAQRLLAEAQSKPTAPTPAPVITAAQGEAVIVLASVTQQTEAPQKPEATTPTTPVVDPDKLADVTALSQAATDIREVTGNRVNLRKGPGTDYAAVGKLTRGQAVQVLADTGDGWLKLRVVETGRIGFMADFLLTASN